MRRCPDRRAADNDRCSGEFLLVGEEAVFGNREVHRGARHRVHRQDRASQLALDGALVVDALSERGGHEALLVQELVALDRAAGRRESPSATVASLACRTGPRCAAAVGEPVFDAWRLELVGDLGRLVGVRPLATSSHVGVSTSS